MSIQSFLKERREVISYLIVGVLTTVVSLGSYFICVHTFLDPNDGFQLQAANVISWICAVTFAYFTNRKFVFQSKKKNILVEAIKFYASRLGTLGMEMLVMFILVTLIALNDTAGKFIAQVIVMIANYFISKIFVFRKKALMNTKKVLM